MRRTLIVTLILFTLYLSNGFKTLIQGRVDIENALYVSTVGIDKSGDKLKLTFATRSIGVEDESENTKKQDQYFVAEGETLFEANRIIRSNLSRRLFWGEVDYILISEELAEKGVDGYIDFLLRDPEVRLVAEIMIVKDLRAEEVIKMVNDSGLDITEHLNSLMKDISHLSTSKSATIKEAFSSFANEYSGLNVPLLHLKDDEKKEKDSTDTEEVSASEGNENGKRVVLDGYAVLDQEDAKLIGFLTGDDARGLNYVKNEIKSGVIVVKDSEGEFVSLEIISSKTKLIPKFDGDKLKITLKNTSSSNVAEIMGTTNIFTDKQIEDLIKQQNEIIKSNIQSAIDFAVEHNIDILDISQVTNIKFPIKWNKIKDDWNQIFPEITFNVEVESIINRTYSIKDPALSREGG
ncbi:Ger(x)C family spore germination protein [Mycoplasmatota bacterium WC44]